MLADLADGFDLLAAAPEHLERGQTLQQIKEEGAHPAQFQKAPLGQRPSAAADERQEQHNTGPVNIRISVVGGSSTQTTSATKTGMSIARKRSG